MPTATHFEAPAQVDAETRSDAAPRPASGHERAVRDRPEAIPIDNLLPQNCVTPPQDGVAFQCDNPLFTESCFPLNALSLEHLSVRHSSIQSTRIIGKMTRLRTLYLGHTRISDMTGLADLTQLEALDLSYTHIASLHGIAAMRKLVWLDLSGVTVDSLAPLHQLEQLEEIYLADTALPPASLRALQEALPKTSIFVDFCRERIALTETSVGCIKGNETPPDVLGAFPHLETVHLYGFSKHDSFINNLTSAVPRTRVRQWETISAMTGSSETNRESFPPPTSRRVIRRNRDTHTLSGHRIKGPCVDPLRHAAKEHGFNFKAAHKDLDLDYRFQEDFDGDGQTDLVVQFYNVSMDTLMYVMRGDCGYFVGDIRGSGELERTTDTRVNGLFDVIFKISAREDRRLVFRRPFRFDKKKYRYHHADLGKRSFFNHKFYNRYPR